MRFKALFFLFFFMATMAICQTVETKEINENGVYGNLYYPKLGKNLPTVIVVSGSGGGIEFSNSFGKPLAEKGFAVLALPYWKYRDLPKNLSEIPLEYFYKAISILKNEAVVDSTKLGIIGFSRGGELALLLASKTKDIKTVVALSAGAYVAPNIDFRNWWKLKSAWTENNEELPFLPKERAVEEGNWQKVFEQIKLGRNRDSLLVEFEAIKNHSDFEKSALKVEKISGSVLLISGGQDMTWASEAMSDYIIERLHKKQFNNFNAHLNYPLAGHDFITLGFDNEITEPELIEKYVENEYPPGGTIDNNLNAGKYSWEQLLLFLDLNLKKI